MSKEKDKEIFSHDSTSDVSLHETMGKHLSDIQKDIFDLCNIKVRNKIHSVGGHTDWIREIFITHDNTKVVSVSDDSTARLWDMSTGRCLLVYVGHSNTVRACAITPDDSILATGSWDKTIRVWELETGKCLKILKGHTARIRSLVISSDGKYIYSGSEDKTARKWSLETGKCIRVYKGHKKAVRVVAIMPGGQYLYTGSEDSLIKKWDTKTGICTDTLQEHNGEIFALYINKTGTTLFSGGRDGIAMEWETSRNTCIKKYKGHKNWIMTLSLSPDEQTLLTGDLDGIVKLWDVRESTPIYTFGGPTWGVNALRFSNDSKLVFFGSEHRAGIIDIGSRNCLREFKGHSKNVSAICLNKDNTILATSGWDGVVNIWDTKTGKIRYKLVHRKTKGHGILSLYITDNNKFLLTGSDNGYIIIWDLLTGKFVRGISTKTDNIHGICMTPDMNRIIICCRELYENIRIYDFFTGELVQHFWGHDNTVFTLDISTDGTLLASGSADNTARIWDIKNGICLHIFREHSDWVETVRISRDNKYLITGGCDLKVRVWKIETEELVHEFTGCSHTIYSVDISSDNKMIMAGGNDKVIRIWDMETGDLINTLYGNDYQLYSADFDRQGTRIVSSGKYSLRMWSVSGGERIREFTGCTNSVCALYVNPYTHEVLIGCWEFGARKISIKKARVTKSYRYCMSATYAVYMSHSGERIVAGGRCVLTNLLDAKSGKQLRWFEHSETVNALLLNSRGDYLYTASSDHCARRWSTHYISCSVIYKGHKGAVYDLKLGKDEKKLYTCSSDKTIKEWDAEKGTVLKTFKGHSDAVSTILLTWDELFLISGSKDGTIRFWEVASGISFKTIKTDKYVTALAMTITGSRIISGSNTGDLSVWDSDTGACIKHMNEHLGWISGIAIIEDENLLISSSYDGTVKFWTLSSLDLRTTYYNLNEGFLWTTPPDENAPSGRFWTDRIDIINVIECEKGGENPEVFHDTDPEREKYLKLYNNKDIVIKRLNTKDLQDRKAHNMPVVGPKTKLLEDY